MGKAEITDRSKQWSTWKEDMQACYAWGKVEWKEDMPWHGASTRIA
jgi:hypothetical protein